MLPASPSAWQVWLQALLLCAGLLAGASCRAARPLMTDDAGVNPVGGCQVEAWRDRGRQRVRFDHVDPACGVAEGLEVGLDLVRSRPGGEQDQGRALTLKWSPEWAQWGMWRFGVTTGTSWLKSPATPQRAAHWRTGDWSAIAIASAELSDTWALHLNAGHQHDLTRQGTATVYASALTWRPHERWVLFAEALGNTRNAAVKAVGLRYWLIPDQLGLDLTAGRNGAGARQGSWGMGIGWYGIQF